jgi:predicted O-methyltransferase YrrM
MNVSEAVEFASKVPGFYSEEELTLLATLVDGLIPGSVVVEIGVEFGRSASILLCGVRDNLLSAYFVDSNMTEESKSLINGYGTIQVGDTAVLIETTSELAAKEWTKKGYPKIDLLHIDADHEEGKDRGPWLDCTLWLPKLNPGGIVCFHDYKRPSPGGEVFPGVTKAADHFTKGWESLGLVDTLVAFRKPAGEVKQDKIKHDRPKSRKRTKTVRP